MCIRDRFIGCKYKDAGSDPHTGVDCSGFTRYVMKYGAGVNIARSSVAQSGEGKEVNADQMRPGDLVFYSKNGKNINHVAMYIGDGMVVPVSYTHLDVYKRQGKNRRKDHFRDEGSGDRL